MDSKVEESFDYSIEGGALWWIEILKRKYKTEWRKINKTIVLPYKEVF